MTQWHTNLVRNISIVVSVLVIGGAVGCASPSSDRSVEPRNSATSSAPVVLEKLDCETLLPLELASASLSLPAESLIDPTTLVQPLNGGSLQIALEASAVAAGGLVTCAYSTQDDGEGAVADDGSHRSPTISVAALPNSAAEFSTIEPEANDGLQNFSALDLGDLAFVACSAPESDSCRAEILVGTTWISASLTPRPTQEAFLGFAQSIVTAVQAVSPVTPVDQPQAIGCEALLTPDDLFNEGGIADAIATDRGAILVSGAGIRTAAGLHSGFINCSWADASGSLPNMVRVMVLPKGKDSWDERPPKDLTQTIQLEEVHGLGDEAFAGCGAESCEVDVLDGEVWLTLQNYHRPADNLSGTVALARLALANYRARN